MRFILFVFGITAITGCLSSHKAARSKTGGIKEIRLVNEYIIPNGLSFKNTVISGLSGIDYDAKRDLYYLVSDDPSSRGATRYFTAKIPISQSGIDSVQIVDMTPLLTPQGLPFPDITKDRL